MSIRRIGFAVGIFLASTCAQANPEGPQVVHGTASFAQPNAQTLNVTNSHNAVINWQGFSIGQGQTTNFIQPGSASAVLNRVVGNNPSQILGNLNSNGQVFLINQHGLMVGSGAQINTAGFYGSTLNITNEDFLSGKLKFEGGGFGGIRNHGYIHAGPNGNVVLIAPDIENGGVIEVDNGNVILAAGESITITSLNDASIEFDLQSPDNGIVNLGEIIANQGAARLFAGNLTHSGAINATGIVQNADGSISLVAQQDIEVTDTATLNADGTDGGSIRVQSHHGDVYFEGTASAQGESGNGGTIEVLGDRVGLFGEAVVDASGKTGGGEILIGGDYQGQGDTQTATQTQVGPHARIHADAIDTGDAGKVIVWADETTIFEGEASATGGADSGNGGFIEVSGKNRLDFTGMADASATNGESGSILFDPRNLTVQIAGGATAPPEFNPPLDTLFAFDEPTSSTDSIIAPVAITNITDTGTAVELNANNSITINDAIQTNEGGAGGDLTLRAGNSILINADILTDNGKLTLIANEFAGQGVVDADRGPGAAEIRMADGVTIDTRDRASPAFANNLEVVMQVGNDKTNAGTGDITLATVIANDILIRHNGQDADNSILSTATGSITANSLFIDHDDFDVGAGGDRSIGTPGVPLNLISDFIAAHIHGDSDAGIYIDAVPNLQPDVTVGGTCYGDGDGGVNCGFGHLIKGLDTDFGDLLLNANGSGLIVIEPIDIAGQADITAVLDISTDPDNKGNPLAIRAGTLNVTSIAGDILITGGTGLSTSLESTSNNLNLFANDLILTEGSGDGDALVIVDNGTGALFLNGAPCATCNPLAFDPRGNGSPDGGVIAANFPVSVSWDGGAGTFNWTDPLNWSTDNLPLGNADVTIDTGAPADLISLASGDHDILSLDMPGNDSLAITGTLLDIANASTINTDLTINGPAAVLNLDGPLTINGALNLGQGTLSGPGDVSVAGLTTWDPPAGAAAQNFSLTGSGFLFANGGFDLGSNLDGDTLTLDKLVNVGGSFSFWDDGAAGGNAIVGSGSIVNNGSINAGNIAQLDVGVPVINNAGISKDSGGGLLLFSSLLTMNSGSSLYIAESTSVSLGGSTLLLNDVAELGGAGTFIGDVLSSGGVIDVEISTGGTGTLTINGNLTLDIFSTLAFDLAGTTQSTTYDFLDVTGTADLDGTVALFWDNGFIAPNGTTFDLVRATGGFGGSAFDTVIDPAGVTSSLTPIVTGPPDIFSYTTTIVSPNIVQWNLNASGSWETGANWLGGTAPAPTDYVVINQDDDQIVISISSDVTILGMQSQNSITIDSGSSLTLNDDLLFTGSNFVLDGTGLAMNGIATVAGQLDWNSGAIAGSGSIDIYRVGVLNINAGVGSLDNDIFINSVQASAWSSSAGGSGTITVNGVLDINGSFITGIPLTNNFNGTISKSDASVTTFLGTVTNNGTLNIDSGTLDLRATAAQGGVINIAAGASLITSDANFNNIPGAIVGGSGTLDVGTGTFFNDGILQPGGPGATGIFTITGNFTAGSTSNLLFEINDTGVLPGTDFDQIVFNGATAAITLDGALTATLLGGSPVATTYRLIDITGASATRPFDFAFESLAPGFAALVYGPQSPPDPAGPSFVETTFAGSIFWDDGGADDLWNTANNWSGDAVPLLADDVSIGAGFSVTIAAAANANSLSLAATSTITQTAGTLTLATGGTLSGNYNLNGGTLANVGTLTFDNGTFTLGGGTLSGGTLATSGPGSVTFSANSSLDGVTLASDITIPSGIFVSVNSGDLTLGNNVTLTIDNSSADTRLLLADGMSILSLGFADIDVVGNFDSFSGLTQIGVTSSFTIGSGVRIRVDDGSIGSTNVGTTVVNFGTIQAVNPGDVLRLNDVTNNAVIQADGGEIFLQGNWSNSFGLGEIRSSNGGTVALTGNLNNDGLITIDAGSFVTTTGNDSFNNLPGATILGDGTFITAGTGTLVNDGTLAPGGFSSIGILTVQGNLTLGSTADLDIDIDDTGILAGTDFDQLRVTGPTAVATLDGAITINLVNSTPAPGSTFRFLDALGGATVTNGFGFESLPAGFLPVEVGADFARTTYQPGLVFWDDGGNVGDWFDPLNWSADAVPTIGDDVSIAGIDLTINIAVGGANAGTLSLASGYTLDISGGGSLTIASDSTLQGDLVLTNGNLTSNGVLQFDGNFDWQNGNLFGAGQIITANTASIAHASTGGINLDWNNAGTITFSAGALQVNSGTVFTNNGIFNLTGGTQILADGGAGVETFVNAAQLNVNSDFAMQPEQFDNAGTITVASGVTLTLGVTGSAFAGNQTGTWDFTDATITLASNNWVLGPGFAVASLPGATLNLNGGDLTNSSGGLVTLPANVAVNLVNANSAIQGADDIQIDGPLALTQGTLAGTGLLTTTGTSTVNSGGTFAFLRDWTNSGTIDHTGGILRIDFGATLTNDGIYNASGGTQVRANGGAGIELFVNGATGQFNVNSDFTMQPEQFDNAGTITVGSGFTLTLGQTGSAFASNQTGTWDFTDATISLALGEWVLGPGFAVAGLPGATLNLNGGDLTNGSGGLVTLPANVAVNLANANSAIQGADDIQIDGPLALTQGTLAGTGLLTTTGTSTVNSGGTFAFSRDWTNSGTIDHTGGILRIDFGATLTNDGIYNASGGTQVRANGGAGTELFVNAAQLNVNSDFAMQPEQFDNAGTITVASGFTLTLGQTGSAFASNQTGTWDFTDATISLALGEWVLGPGFAVAGLPGATLNLNGGDLTNGSGGLVTLPANVAVNLVNANSAIQGADDIQIDGPLALTQGTLAGAGLLTTTGTTTVNSGGTFAFSRDWTNSGTIEHTGGILRIDFGTTLTNDGIYNVSGGTQVRANGGAGIELFVNGATGQFNVNSDFTMQPEQFDNAGTITVGSGFTLTLGVTGSAFAGNQTGTWDFTDATITLASNNWVLGPGFAVASLPGATLNLNGGDLSNSSGGLVTLPANVAINLNNAGSAIQGADDIQIDGAFNWTAGTLAGTGLLTTTGTSTISSGATLGLDRDWTNTGTINHTGGTLQIQNGTILTNSNIYNASGGLAITANGGTGIETLVNDPASVINVSANFSISAEQFDQNGVIALAGGNLTIANLANVGTLTGSGQIIGNLSNTGIVRPGGQNTIGTLTVTGNFTQTTGVIEIEIQSLPGVAGTDYDLLSVGGTADTQGTLTLLAIGGYIVADGDSLSPITYNTFAGNQFGTINSIGIETVNPTYGINSIDLVLNLSGAIVWNGASDQNWFNTGNWIGGVVPTNADNATIPGGSGFIVTIAGAADANSLSLAADANLVVNSGSLTLSGNSALDGLLTLNAGTLDITGITLTLNGGLDWTAGATIAGAGGTLLNAPGSTIDVTGAGGNAILDFATIDNQGTVNHAAVNPLLLNNGATLDNNGQFDFQGDSGIASGAGGGTFNNNSGGQIVKSVGVGASTFFNSITFTSSDAGFNAISGSIQMQSPATFGGVTTSANASSLVFSGGNATFADGSSVSGDFTLTFGGSLTVAGTTTINDTLFWDDSSTIGGAGTLVIAPTATLDMTTNFDHFVDTATIDNQGTIIHNFVAALQLNNGATLDNNGQFDFQDDGLITSGVGVGSFNNNPGGQLVKSGGTGTSIIFTSTTFNQNGATVDLQSGTLSLNGRALTLNAGSLLTGSATFADDVINNGGSVEPGGVGVVGTLSIGGDFTNTSGTVVIDILNAVTTPGTDYDQLAVTNQADFGDTLQFNVIGTYVVANNDTLDPVAYATWGGNPFTTITAIGGENITDDYTAPDLTLTLSFSGLFTFTGAIDNSWNNPGNWDQGLPGIGNDALIPAGFTVTISAAADANTLSLAAGSTLDLDSGGVLTITTSATFDGLFSINAGGFDITGATATVNAGLNWTGTSVITGGTLNLNSALNITGGVSNILDGTTVNAAGTVTYLVGGLTLANGANLNVTDTFDFAGDVGIVDGGGAASSFSTGSGSTVIKSAGALTSSIDSTLLSTIDGSVVVQTGTLDLNLVTLSLDAGDVFAGSGTYIGSVVNNGGTVRPGGSGVVGTLTVIGDFTNTAGTFEVEINSAITQDVLAVSNFLDNSNAASSILDISLLSFVPAVSESHDVITCVSACTTVAQFGTVNQPTGVTHSINYNATNLNLTVTSVSFFWDGGGVLDNWFDPLNWSLDVLPNLGTDVVLASGNNVTFDGGAATVASLTLNAGSSLNLASGTLNVLAGSSDLAVNGGAVLSINGGALINDGNATFGGSYAHGSGSATFTGNSVFNAGYSHSGGNATFGGSVAFNAANIHGGGSTVFNGVTSMSGATSISGGTLTFNAVGTLLNLNNTWSGGTIAGPAAPNLVLGVVPGDTTLAVVGAGTKTLDTLTLDMNQNDINMSGGGNLVLANGATIDNTNGTSFNHSGNGGIVGTGTFDNSNGHFNKLSGSALIAPTVNFINTGTSLVNVAGGALTFAAGGVDAGNYNVGGSGTLFFSNGRTLGGTSTMTLGGNLVVGNGVSPTTLTLPGTFVNTGNIQLNNATLDLSNLGGTLSLVGGAGLGGTGTVAGNLVNSSGLLVVGGVGALGNLAISGAYTQNPGSAVVVDVFNNGVTTVPDVLSVTGATTLNGGALVIGFVSNSLGLVTANFQPFNFNGGVSGNFSSVFDAGGNILFINFSGGSFTVLGAPPVIPDSIVSDLVGFLSESEEISETANSNKAESEAIIEELLEAKENEEGGSLVCNI